MISLKTNDIFMEAGRPKWKCGAMLAWQKEK